MTPLTDALLAALVVVLTGNLAITWRNHFRIGLSANRVDGLGSLLEGFGEHVRAIRESQRAQAHYSRWLAEHINQEGPQGPPPPPPEIR